MDVESLNVEPLLATFILGITTVVLFYWYVTRKHTYWQERGVPHVKPIPIFGSLHETLFKPLHEIEVSRYKKCGKIYGHYEGSRPVISVADPKHLRNIMIKDFPSFSSRRNFQTGNEILDKNVSALRGDDWRRIRTIITPTFTTGKIKRMIGIFKECAKTCAQNYLQYAKKGKPVNIKQIYGTFTMDVIASAAFSTKIDSHNDPNNKFVVNAMEVFTVKFNWRVSLLMLFPGLVRLFKISNLSPSGLKFFEDVTLDIIKERSRTGQTRNDFLQLLLDTAKGVQDQEKTEVSEKDILDNYGKQDFNDQLFKNMSKKGLTQSELVAQCVIFFLAGYDTTNTALCFVSYLLALNPDVQDKLVAEIAEVVSASNGEMTYDALQNMKYMDNVISEALRLYPPAVRLERLTQEDYKLGDTGITIPKDMIVTIPIYAMQRDPEFFPDPEKFNPDRFSPEQRATWDPFTYLPFGSGPRNCVAMRFALMEIKVCLAVILSQFRIRRCPQTKVPMEYNFGQQQLLQPKDVTVQMEVREHPIAVR